MTIQVIPAGGGTTQSAIQAITSETIDTDNKGLRIGTLSVHAICSSLNGADATLRLQHSDNNVNWSNLDSSDSSIGLVGASGVLANGSNILTPVFQLAMRYYRLVYTPNSNTAGTIQVIVNLL